MMLSESYLECVRVKFPMRYDWVHVKIGKLFETQMQHAAERGFDLAPEAVGDEMSDSLVTPPGVLVDIVFRATDRCTGLACVGIPRYGVEVNKDDLDMTYLKEGAWPWVKIVA